MNCVTTSHLPEMFLKKNKNYHNFDSEQTKV
jgi:hypothetical protein